MSRSSVSVLAALLAWGCTAPPDPVAAKGSSETGSNESPANPTPRVESPNLAAPPAVPPKAEPNASPADPQSKGTTPPKTSPTKPGNTTGKGKDKPFVSTPQKPRTEGWTPSATKASEIAAQVDTKLKGLTGISMEAKLGSEQMVGKSLGTFKCQFATPTKFRVEYPTFGLTEQEGIKRDALISDGRNFSVYDDKGFTQPTPLASANLLKGKSLTKEWPKKFGSLVFAGVGTNQKPISQYLAEASKPNSGYTVTVEDRSVLYEGRRIDNQRVLVRRSPEAAKKLGPEVVEMVFDSQLRLPVTIRVQSTRPAEKETRVNWSAKWFLRPNQTFEAKTFQIPI